MRIGPDRKIDDTACRVFQRAAELAGRKWNAAIMMGLSLGMVRFTELRDHIDGISDRLLTARLRELEQAKLVARTVIPTTPVQVRYSLTPAGSELMRVLRPLVDWAHHWDTDAAETSPQLTAGSTQAQTVGGSTVGIVLADQQPRPVREIATAGDHVDATTGEDVSVA